MAGVSKSHDRIHSDLYDKINTCTAAVTGLTSELKTLKKAMAAETDRYVELLHRAQDRQFKVAGCLVLVIIFCVGIIGYGAIGKGMYTVRRTMPFSSDMPSVTSDMPYIPPDNRNVLKCVTEPDKAE